MPDESSEVPFRGGGTVILEAGPDPGQLLLKLESLRAAGPGRVPPILVLVRPGSKAPIPPTLLNQFPSLKGLELGPQWRKELHRSIPTRLFAYLPAQSPYSPPPWDEAGKGDSFLLPWFPPPLLPVTAQMTLLPPVSGWIADKDLLLREIPGEGLPTLRDFESLSASDPLSSSHPLSFSYLSAPALPSFEGSPSDEPPFGGKPYRIQKNSRVLGIVPYYQCRPWLEECLRSLVGQTRPLDGIVVVDDGTGEPPLDLVGKFNQVTLWGSAQNVGPYRIAQSVIEATQYDAYLFQDADDWSSLDRLERLLEAAQSSGAELIGTQELMYLTENLFPNAYARDVNRALSRSKGYALLHPSSLVSRDLVMRLGGYSSGMRFGGDLEFQLRAIYAARVRNLDRFCYFRRIRQNSLITSEATGLASPARRELQGRIWARADENRERTAGGKEALLKPIAPAGTLKLDHLMGPPLKRT